MFNQTSIPGVAIEKAARLIIRQCNDIVPLYHASIFCDAKIGFHILDLKNQE